MYPSGENCSGRSLDRYESAEPPRKKPRREKHGSKAPPLRAELACGEVFQRAQACVEFGGRQAPHAVERAQKVRDRTVALARIAFDAAGTRLR